MKFFSFLLFYSFQSMAQECIPIEAKKFADFNSIQKHLDWHGANNSQIEKTHCKTIVPPSEEEIERLIASKATGSSRGKVHGVSFQNESPKLIQAFKNLTTAKDAFGWEPEPKDQKNFQATFNINPSCQKVRCAVEKIWGKMGKKILYLYLKHNYNGSEYAFKNSDRFKEEEIDDVLMGVDDLPPSLIPMGAPNQRLTHFKRGYTLEGYDQYVAANAVVMLFDTWSGEPRRERQYSVFHEISHNTSTKLGGLDESPRWLALSSWVRRGDKWSSSPTACQITEYGKANPWEDFAESMSTYRYNGAKFKNKCPEKYEFMRKKVFKGLEYTDLIACAPIKAAQIKQVRSEILKSLKNDLAPETFTVDDVTKVCEKSFSLPALESEIAECSMKLISQSTQMKSSEKMELAFKTAGLEDTPYNRSLVLSEMDPLLKNDLQLKEKMLASVKGVPEAIQLIADKSITDGVPEGMGLKGMNEKSMDWYFGQDKCRAKFLTGASRQEIISCHVDVLIAKDKDSQEWNNGNFPKFKLPAIFKPEAEVILKKSADTKLKEHLLQEDVTRKAMDLAADEFKQTMQTQLYIGSSKLYEAKNWKKLPPEEFCSKFYSQGSSFMGKYGIKEGATIPAIQNWCVSKQSQSRRRKEIKERDWDEFVQGLIKP